MLGLIGSLHLDFSGILVKINVTNFSYFNMCPYRLALEYLLQC